jgi:hypothetical protein
VEFNENILLLKFPKPDSKLTDKGAPHLGPIAPIVMINPEPPQTDADVNPSIVLSSALTVAVAGGRLENDSRDAGVKVNNDC